MKIRNAAAAASLLLLAGFASAQSVTLYSNTFEARELGSMWSLGTHLSDYTRTFTTFNGQYSSGSTTLTLGAAARPAGASSALSSPYNQYTLTFDFYALDSWDGSSSSYGPDRFKVLVNDVTLFDNTFSNHVGGTQTFRAPDVGGSNLGYGTWNDAIYRNISLTFRDPGTSTIRILFKDGGLQGVNDESWGIDNVRVSYVRVTPPTVVPAPSAGLVLAGGAGLLSRRRRA
jgi:hypothetical protein